jgi:hypothetical protein
MFYADLAVSRDDVNCGRALVNLAEFAKWVRTLGTYRASREVLSPSANGVSATQPVGESEGRSPADKAR